MSHSLTSLLISSEKCKYWEAVKHIVADMSFPEFSFSLESSNFITGTKTVSCCSLSDRCPCLPDTQV